MKRFKISVKDRERRTTAAQACECDFDIERVPRPVPERRKKTDRGPRERRSVSPLS